MPKSWIMMVLVLATTAGACRSECETDKDCKGARICDAAQGICVDPALCPSNAPVDCGAVLPGLCCPATAPICCPRDNRCYEDEEGCSGCAAAGIACGSTPCCAGLTCQGGRCTATPTCRKATDACLTSAVCCTGLTCSRFGLFCRAATGLDLGEPCNQATECRSGRCDGFCSRPCSSNASCTNATFCIQTAVGNICVPWCGSGSSTRCSVYDGATCQAAQDVTGSSQAVCLGQ